MTAPKDEAELDNRLSDPSPATCKFLQNGDGDILVLGASGKIGPTFCRLVKKAAPSRKVWGVSRFTDREAEEKLRNWNIETIQTDLTAMGNYEALPSAPDIYFLVGRKFGSSGKEWLTWAVNTLVPAFVCERFPYSRISVLSTGNVYPLTKPTGTGPNESTEPQPKGEYAQSCLGRERLFEYFSRLNGTQVVILRLNYANEPRYGVVVDLTRRILAGQTVDLSMGYVNLIWQGDASDYLARSLDLASTPPTVLNVAGGSVISIREIAEEIGELIGRKPVFRGKEASTALLSDPRRCRETFGPPRISTREMVQVVVEWVKEGRPILDRPTHFEVRNGRF